GKSGRGKRWSGREYRSPPRTSSCNSHASFGEYLFSMDRSTSVQHIRHKWLVDDCLRHELLSRSHDTAWFLFSWARSVRKGRLPEPVLHPSKPYACPSPRLPRTRSIGGSRGMVARCNRYPSPLNSPIQGQAAFRRHVSEATVVIVQRSGLRFRYHCSLPELGRHRTDADASWSTSGYGSLLFDSLQRRFSLYPLGSSKQRPLSSSLGRFLRSGAKSCLGETASSI